MGSAWGLSVLSLVPSRAVPGLGEAMTSFRVRLNPEVKEVVCFLNALSAHESTQPYYPPLVTQGEGPIKVWVLFLYFILFVKLSSRVLRKQPILVLKAFLF